MEEVMAKVNLKNLDKSNWKSFRFDEIAQKISKTVKPEEAEVDIYVGLEHLDREDIHIRRKGVPSDVKGGKLRCYPGDIIFGKRRAYQRKAAIVDFDGICSAHAFVFRAIPEVIGPKLFPFFLHSDQFMHRMVDISVGGLSPTINWGDLKHQEFLLPPKDQQAQLAELLWAMDEVVEKEMGVLESCLTVKGSMVKSNCIVDIKGTKKRLYEIIDHLEAGVSVNSEEGTVDENSFGILKTSAVSEGYFIPTEVKRVLSKEYHRLKAPVRQNSIIISRMNTVELVGANGYVEYDYDNLFLPDRLWQTQIKSNEVNVKFLWYILSSPTYRSKISDLCTGTSNSMKNISKKSFLRLEIVLPSKSKQDLITKEIDVIQGSINKVESKIAASKSLQKSLINQIF